jgi:hypothetical protein
MIVQQHFCDFRIDFLRDRDVDWRQVLHVFIVGRCAELQQRAEKKMRLEKGFNGRESKFQKRARKDDFSVNLRDGFERVLLHSPVQCRAAVSRAIIKQSSAIYERDQ